MATFNIVTLPGDGIGPDIVREAVKVMNKIGELYGHNLNCFSYDIWTNTIAR